MKAPANRTTTDERSGDQRLHRHDGRADKARPSPRAGPDPLLVEALESESKETPSRDFRMTNATSDEQEALAHYTG